MPRRFSAITTANTTHDHSKINPSKLPGVIALEAFVRHSYAAPPR